MDYFEEGDVVNIEALLNAVVGFLNQSVIPIPLSSSLTINITLMEVCVGGLLTVVICEAVWKMID